MSTPSAHSLNSQPRCVPQLRARPAVPRSGQPMRARVLAGKPPARGLAQGGTTPSPGTYSTPNGKPSCASPRGSRRSIGRPPPVGRHQGGRVDPASALVPVWREAEAIRLLHASGGMTELIQSDDHIGVGNVRDAVCDNSRTTTSILAKGGTDMIDPEAITEARRALGRQLAALPGRSRPQPAPARATGALRPQHHRQRRDRAADAAAGASGRAVTRPCARTGRSSGPTRS